MKIIKHEMDKFICVPKDIEAGYWHFTDFGKLG